MPNRRSALDALTLLAAAALLAACSSDSPDPAGPGGPEGPDLATITLESNRLDAGGTGAVISDGFADLALEPGVDEDGAVDAKLARERKGSHVLQIALYSDLLAKAQGAAPERTGCV